MSSRLYIARPEVTRWNTIFDSLIRAYNKLIELGFTYYNGKVAIIEDEEVSGE